MGQRGGLATRRRDRRHLDEFSGLPGWRDVFAPGGRPLAEGHRLVQANLAGTLARIAAEGARAFYEGPVARDIARSVAAAGGFLDEADLATIRAESQKPLTARYRDLEIYTQPPISCCVRSSCWRPRCPSRGGSQRPNSGRRRRGRSTRRSTSDWR